MTVRLAKGLALAVLILSAASCRKEGAISGPVFTDSDVQIQLGVAGVIENESWNLLRLRVRNRGLDFRGTLAVRGQLLQGVGDAVAYTMELEVPGGLGPFREYEILVRLESWSDVDVTLEQPGFRQSFRQAVALPAARTLRILVIGDRHRDFTPLEKLVKFELQKEESAGIPPREVRTCYLPPADCPALARAYDPFQLIILDSTSLMDAPEESVEALTVWARSGGTLAAIPRPDWVGGRPARLENLLSSAAILPEPPVGEKGSLPWQTDAPDFYRALIPSLARASSFAGDMNAVLRQIERDVAGSLFKQAGLRIPSRASLFLGLAVYVLVGFFLPTTICKRLGRREWSFAFMIVAAIAAAISIYGLGVLSQIDSLEIAEVSVVRVSPGAQPARTTSFLGIVSPRFTWLDLHRSAGGAALSGALPQPLRAPRMENYRRAEDLPVADTEVQIEKNREQRLAPARLYPNAVHYLRIDHDAPVGGILQFERPGAEGGKRGVRIVNSGRSDVHLYVVQGAQQAHWMELKPGESADGPDWSALELKPMSGELATSPYLTRPQLEALALVLNAVASPWAGELGNRYRGFEEQNEQSALRPWIGFQPRALVAVAETQVFPPVEDVTGRKGFTIFIAELPPEGGP